MATTETNPLLSRVLIEKVLCQGELDLLEMLMAPDAVVHELETFSPSAAQGTKGFREFIEVFRSAFPDLRVSVVDQLADGDRVATRWRMEGTQSGRLMGIEASHRPVSIDGIRIDRMAHGRIAESWNQWDTIGMLRQLGALPALDRQPAAVSRPDFAVRTGPRHTIAAPCPMVPSSSPAAASAA